jgi:hypothetical protein
MTINSSSSRNSAASARKAGPTASRWSWVTTTTASAASLT